MADVSRKCCGGRSARATPLLGPVAAMAAVLGVGVAHAEHDPWHALPDLPPAPVASPALAQVVGPLELTILRTVTPPLQQPEVILHSEQAMSEVSVEVRVGGQVASRQYWALLPSGAHRSVTWRAPVGEHRATVAVHATLSGQPFDAQTSAMLQVLPPLEVSIAAADVDTYERRLTFRSSRPAQAASATFFDLDGRLLRHQEFAFERPATVQELRWPAMQRSVAHIALRVFGSDDSWAEVDWQPIQMELPPPPLVFESGVQVSSEDRSKLDKLAAEVRAFAAGHRGVRGLTLYVLGVGTSVGAKAMAAERAHQVARQMKRRGVAMPIKAAGIVDPAQRDGIEYLVSEGTPLRAEWRPVR